MSTREQFGKYLLLKKLTEDPLGETFRAGLLGGKGMERVVLLRIFNGQGIDGGRLWQAMQQREAVQSALKSPSIGDGVDMGEIEGIPYVAYDYVSGKNMANLLEQAAKRRNFVPAEHALLITERLALALASANETRVGDQRVSHGFVVPHLAIISNEGETRLLGFEAGPGLRGFAANPVIRQHFGRYLAPEALAGSPPDRSDDVYSLGVVLFELLTGRPLPPPSANGYGPVIDEAVVATEGEPLAPEVSDLLKQSLVPREQRIADVATWHKTLNKFMFEGQYNPTTFNLAFFMHNLFRQEIEQESQEIEVEKTLPVPTVAKAPGAAPPPPPTRESTGTGVVAGAAAAAATGTDAGTGTGTAPGFERTGTAIAAAPERKSNTGLIVGALAALLLLALAGWWFLGRGGGDVDDTETVAAAQPAPAVVPEPEVEEYSGPSEEELRSQISELVSQQSKMIEDTYNEQLQDLQSQLEQARQEADDRKRRDAERKAREEAEAAEAAAAEEARIAEEERLAEEAAAARRAEEEAARKAAEEEAQVAQAPPPTRPAPPPPAAKPQVRRGDLVEPGPGVVMPDLVRRPTPRYPEMARRFNKKSATVLVRLLVDENGRVLKAELAGEPQKFGFDNEALQAAKKSVYKPATKDGVPVKIWHTISVEFRDR